MCESVDKARAVFPDQAGYRLPVRLSLAAPAFNEAAGIESVIQNWSEYLSKSTEIAEFEIVICNDGSTDATGAILDRLAQSDAKLHPIHFQANQGAAAALTAAIAGTHLDWVLLIDSDGQFPIENLPAMIGAVREQEGAAAIGIRAKKDRWFARFGTASSATVCNLVHRSSIQDFNSAFKLVWGPLLRALKLEAKGMNYSTEVTSRLLEAGVAIAQVPIEHRARPTGASNMKLIRGAWDRALFVSYIAMRQALMGTGVLRRPWS
jgi:dolichol-phosphate mannosyltransferase